MKEIRKIIAVRGQHASGKTSTLNILREELLRQINCTEISYRGGLGFHGTDFICVMEYLGYLIGITSEGDMADLTKTRIQRLIDAKCVIIFCSCRTRNGPIQRTVDAVSSFPEFPVDFAWKERVGPEGRDSANLDFAKQLIARLNQMIQSHIG